MCNLENEGEEAVHQANHHRAHPLQASKRKSNW